MENRIAWMLLAGKNRTSKKIAQLAKEFEKKKKEIDLTSPEALRLADDIEKAQGMGAGIITYIDKEYPEVLRNIAYPPPYLYVRGNVKLLNYPVKVTMVGSREATEYGLNVAMEFAHELSGNRICIVSGGARGIDTAAIKGAMRASDNVIAVIGTGIDVNYPPENKKLFDTIAEKGLVVSEFPMGMGPMPGNFPARNRIMTSLGDSVVVVEAAQKSGALISANHALEQGKTLFAVPGNITNPNSAGTNELLRDGALFALSSTDILYELMERMPDAYRSTDGYDTEDEEETYIATIEPPETNEDENKNLSPHEVAVINAIKKGKNTYDEILEFTAMETNKLTSLLTIMEIKGIIKLAFGNRYKLNN